MVHLQIINTVALLGADNTNSGTNKKHAKIANERQKVNQVCSLCNHGNSSRLDKTRENQNASSIPINPSSQAYVPNYPLKHEAEKLWKSQ